MYTCIKYTIIPYVNGVLINTNVLLIHVVDGKNEKQNYPKESLHEKKRAKCSRRTTCQKYVHHIIITIYICMINNVPASHPWLHYTLLHFMQFYSVGHACPSILHVYINMMSECFCDGFRSRKRVSLYKRETYKYTTSPVQYYIHLHILVI